MKKLRKTGPVAKSLKKIDLRVEKKAAAFVNSLKVIKPAKSHPAAAVKAKRARRLSPVAKSLKNLDLSVQKKAAAFVNSLKVARRTAHKGMAPKEVWRSVYNVLAVILAFALTGLRVFGVGTTVTTSGLNDATLAAIATGTLLSAGFAASAYGVWRKKPWSYDIAMATAAIDLVVLLLALAGGPVGAAVVVEWVLAMGFGALVYMHEAELVQPITSARQSGSGHYTSA